MNLVRVISTELDNLKSRIVKILRYGKNDVQTAVEAAPYGIDGNPIKDMIAIYAQTEDKGETVIVGYINNNQKALTGELRLFSTDADGVEKLFVWLKNDGTLQLGGTAKNLVRFQELEAGFNQLKSDHNALLQAFNTHMHPTAGSGPPSTPTPVPGSIPATASTASIEDAKINEIKTL